MPSMSRAIKKVAKSWLFPDLFMVERTKDEDLLELISKIRPKDCGIPLIRLGTKRGDGGYLIPDDLEGIQYCFSPGVSTVSDFEYELADHNIRSFLADYSVDGPTKNRPEFTFDKKFLGSFDRENFFTLETWKNKYLDGYTGDLILQMDIEGSEYEVILSIPDDLLGQFRMIVIEFHGLDRLFDPFAFGLISACFEKLQKSFHVVHIHPNNCCGAAQMGGIEIPRLMEFTFLNRKRTSRIKPQLSFPHQFDADNLPEARPLVLPKCWYIDGY
jgi:hypothetical protein